jgi:tetratricopeptide (TPR) repeat protein
MSDRLPIRPETGLELGDDSMFWPQWLGPKMARWTTALLIIASVCISATVVVSGLQKSPQTRAEEALVAGAAAFQQGRVEDSETAFRRAAALNPRSVQALYNYGFFAQSNGRARAAERIYRQALRVDPDFAPALLNLAVVIARNRPKESILLLERLIELTPSDPRAYFNIGYVLLKTGREREGLQQLQRSVRMDPTLKERSKRAIALAQRATEGTS